MADTPHLAMSDEEFLNQLPPEKEEATPASEVPVVETGAEDTEVVTNPVIEEPSNPAPTTDTPAEDKSDEDFLKDKPAETPANPDPNANPAADLAEAGAEGAEDKDPKDKKDTPIEGNPADPNAGKKEETKKDDNKKDDIPSGSEPVIPTPEEAQAFYSKIMAPIKANGKTIQLKSPEEAIALMQMGANYTRKLQDLAPHRKLLTMLQNNDLLDESRINFLIDLDKKNPEAIKKLIKDSGIDPLDIDTNTEPAYQEGSHRVTDEEIAFRTTLEELGASDTGKQTLIEVNSAWDQTSKDMAWANPEVLSIIHEQRENGIYTMISEEMNRQKVLGKIAPTVPFLEAYKIVGDQLHEAGAFKGLASENAPSETKTEPVIPPAVTEPPVPVATRAATPKPVVENGDKASAATPTRAAPGKAKEVVNFLSMSDDDFLKAEPFKGRV